MVGKAHITLHDMEFVGPDKRLQESLTRRMTMHNLEPFSLQNQWAYSPINPAFLHSSGPSRRFSELTRNTSKLQVLHLIKFIVYSIQSRLEDFDPIVAKYHNDERIRIGHIFCKLDLWQAQMVRLFFQIKSKMESRFFKHLIVYQHILAINIDVTYTTEFLVRIQNAIGSGHRSAHEQQVYEYTEILQSDQVQNEMAKYKDRNLTTDELNELKMKLEIYLLNTQT